MRSASINLLPNDRERMMRRGYRLRLATVVVLVLAGVIVIHTALLAPSYFYVRQQVAARAAALAAVDTRLMGNEEQEVSARIAILKSQAASLIALKDQTAGTTALRAVLAAPHAGVRLTGFTYTGAKDGQEPRLAISGIADTREALRTYVATLAALPFIERADLPISAYAKERDIGFLVTLTGTFMP